MINQQNELTQGIDRITGILQRQSAPISASPYQPQASQLPSNMLNAIAAASYDYGNGKGGDFMGNVQKYQTAADESELNKQKMLLSAFETKIKLGDAQAKALDDKIALFTGNDPEGRAMFLEALHNDPDPIDPSNAYQVMTKLAGIKKQTGYESPDLQMDKMKEQLDIDLKRSQINATNALANFRNSGGASGKSNKPMPASSLKLLQENIDALSTSSNIKADLGNVISSIESGGLNLGLIENVKSDVRNTLGVSDKNSRNFGSFKATLEKLRNDSLRLNKGVQTEGDSVRAWNEILTNLNDEKFVTQRLREVQEINERGAALQEMNANMILNNYGRDPIDASNYQKPAAILLDEADPRIQKAREAGYSDEEIQEFLESQ